MATNILASGYTNLSSTPRTVDEGQYEQIVLTGTAGTVMIQVQQANSEWQTIGNLTISNPGTAIYGSCTYRVTRLATTPEQACGVDLL